MSVLLEMKGIDKSFPGVKALSQARLELRAGEVHALLGENGAGKSTLIKVLGGIYQKDAGEILIGGKSVEITDVNSAREQGISIIHQELMMLPQMTVAENIFLGKEPVQAGLVKKGEMIRESEKMLREFDLHVDPAERLGRLPIAQQQIIEIVRAI